MRIVCKKYLTLPLGLKRQALGLTHSPKQISGLLYRISYSKNKDKLHTVLCVEGDKILGWALVDKKCRDIMIYVRKNYRRMGVGTKIMKKIRSKFGKYNVYDNTIPTKSFFKSVGF
jgi:GNAT superfamily N-acetyltransferase